jgi:hypothetical protein
VASSLAAVERPIPADWASSLAVAPGRSASAPSSYAYVLEADRLRVLTNRAGEWQPIAEPGWTERPDWDAIDQHA